MVTEDRVLALGTRINAPYHPFGDREARFAEILQGICGTECTDDAGRLKELSSFRGVLCYLDEWKIPVAPECARGLVRFVQEGGGLMLLHNGICIQSDPEIEKMIGGRFLNHPRQEEIAFVPVGFFAGRTPFSVTEEPYRFALRDPGEIVLEYRYRGKTYPAGWRRRFGEGRIMYLCPGHTGEVFDVPAYRDLIRAGMKWCLDGGE